MPHQRNPTRHEESLNFEERLKEGMRLAHNMFQASKQARERESRQENLQSMTVRIPKDLIREVDGIVDEVNKIAQRKSPYRKSDIIRILIALVIEERRYNEYPTIKWRTRLPPFIPIDMLFDKDRKKRFSEEHFANKLKADMDKLFDESHETKASAEKKLEEFIESDSGNLLGCGREMFEIIAIDENAEEFQIPILLGFANNPDYSILIEELFPFHARRRIDKFALEKMINKYMRELDEADNDLA